MSQGWTESRASVCKDICHARTETWTQDRELHLDRQASERWLGTRKNFQSGWIQFHVFRFPFNAYMNALHIFTLHTCCGEHSFCFFIPSPEPATHQLSFVFTSERVLIIAIANCSNSPAVFARETWHNNNLQTSAYVVTWRSFRRSFRGTRRSTKCLLFLPRKAKANAGWFLI